MDKKEKYEDREDATNSGSLAELDSWLNEWFGAIFYFLLSLGKIPFSELSKEKYRKRNIWTGWLVKMMLLVGGLWMAWEFCILF